MALQLMDKNREGAENLKQALESALANTGHCRCCQVIADGTLCAVCANAKRDNGQICVVESALDLMAIEDASAYQGRYFVLNGKISPLDGIGPAELGLEKLQQQCQQARELILAIGPTAEGEATVHYITEMVSNLDIRITRIAYGVPYGGELEYLNHQTLSHAFASRSNMGS